MSCSQKILLGTLIVALSFVFIVIAYAATHGLSGG